MALSSSVAAQDDSSRRAAPWLKLAVSSDGDVKVEGSPQALFGHQIDAAASSPGEDRPAGVYVEWQWDGQRLLVRNDRYGMGQVLYGVLPRQRGIVLASYLDQHLALGVSSELDSDAIAILLRLGFHLGCDTPFKAIRALPPNATLTWSPGSPSELSVQGGPCIPELRTVSRDVAIDGYIERFRMAIQRRPPISGRTVLPITGGQDSRHILFELCHAGTPPDQSVTVRANREARYDDASVAANLAACVGVPHQILLPSMSPVEEDFRKYMRLGVMSDEGGWTSIMRDTIHSYACAYDGIAGDMLSSGSLAGIEYTASLHEKIAGRRWSDVADHILNHFSASEAALAPLLRRASFKDCGRDVVRDRMVEELKVFESAPHPLAMFVIHHRTRREIAMMAWLLCAEVPRYYAPYLDHDLFDWLASLPAEEFAVGQWFHGETIRRAYPEWSNIPYLEKGRIDRPSGRLSAVVSSILELRKWSTVHTPALTRMVSRWGVHRLLSRASASSAPRRVVQHFLVLEQMLRGLSSDQS